MLTNLTLKGFKNFKDASLRLGPFTLLVGANASGKSNIRDAFRFLHGISRGYTLAEIIGEKWIEGGVLQWRGIRGGTREVCFNGDREFSIEVLSDIPGPPEDSLDDLNWEKITLLHDSSAPYTIKVGLDGPRNQPILLGEKLDWLTEAVFDSHPGILDPVSKQGEPNHLLVRMRRSESQRNLGQRIAFLDSRPVLSQLAEHPKVTLKANREYAKLVLAALEGMRFLDLSPDAMRRPSIPGQTILGDQGENLSSVLQAICEDEKRKQTLLDWVRELTPMDAADFEFPADAEGKILLTLVEESGRRISAHSASDGTLRFLATIAALLGPRPAAFYFFEEIDNGIHPTRLHLLLQLIEQQVAKGGIQVVATTHSPDLLGLLSDRSLEDASLIYRLPGHPEGAIRRILDIPDARDLIARQGLRRLYTAGWLEDALVLEDEA